VRASNLNELIYKQGQAGVTKASVTLVFDNSNRELSPHGYDHYNKITVTRQVRRAPSRAAPPASAARASGGPQLTSRRAPSQAVWCSTRCRALGRAAASRARRGARTPNGTPAIIIAKGLP